MKRFLAAALAIMVLLSVGVTALAAETDAAKSAPDYTVIVGDRPLELADLTYTPYPEGDTLMVPLRKIAEALGYQVNWDPETGAITVEDAYIQKAILYGGTETVVFEGKLQIINMSREIENAVETTIHNGYTYVPLEFFQEFWNDTTVEGGQITIAPSMAELQGIT